MKKKLLTFTMILIFAISICACGSNTDDMGTTKTNENQEQQESESVELHKVGDTVATDKAELCLSATEIKNGKELVVSFDIKNIGKTTMDDVRDMPSGGSSKSIESLIEVDYNDGYIYTTEHCSGYKADGNFTTAPYLDIEPLSGNRYYTASFEELPEEFFTNEDAPLNINVYIPCENGDFEKFVFSIR